MDSLNDDSYAREARSQRSKKACFRGLSVYDVGLPPAKDAVERDKSPQIAYGVNVADETGHGDCRDVCLVMPFPTGFLSGYQQDIMSSGLKMLCCVFGGFLRAANNHSRHYVGDAHFASFVSTSRWPLPRSGLFSD